MREYLRSSNTSFSHWVLLSIKSPFLSLRIHLNDDASCICYHHKKLLILGELHTSFIQHQTRFFCHYFMCQRCRMNQIKKQITITCAFCQFWLHRRNHLQNRVFSNLIYYRKGAGTCYICKSILCSMFYHMVKMTTRVKKQPLNFRISFFKIIDCIG